LEIIIIRVTVGKYDYWAERVPESIRNQYPDLSSAIDCIFSQFDNKEASLSLFWKIYDLSKKQLLQTSVELLELESKLNQLENELKKEIRANLNTSSQDIVIFIVYLHVASSLIVVLEDQGHHSSELFKEILEFLDNIFSIYEEKIGQLDSSPFWESIYACVTIIAIRLYYLRESELKYEESFEYLDTAVKAARISGFFISSDEINPQAPVDTFEKLWDNPSIVENWQKLAGYCEEISSDELFGDSDVKWKDEEDYGVLFWAFAKGMCSSRLSLNEYIKLKESDEKREAELRLKNYFFADCWDSIPEEFRDDLKAMDKLWFSKEQLNLVGILGSLKRVTEGLIRKLLWDSFIQWRSSTKNGEKQSLSPDELFYENKLNETLKNIQEFGYEPSLIDFSYMMRHYRFPIFVKSKPYLKPHLEFMQDTLYKNIRDLNKKRRLGEHPKNPKIYKKEDIASLVKIFLGINELGILPLLARMLKESS